MGLQEVVFDGVARALPRGDSEKNPAKVEPSCQGTTVAGDTAIQ
jgi:hypothetical protein